MFGQSVSTIYLGCYKDDTINRDLPNKFSLTRYSIETCAQACKQNSFCYMGLQN